MWDDLLFDEDRCLQVRIHLLEVEVFFLEFILVVESCINTFLDPTSATVHVFIDDDGRILEFACTLFDEALGPFVD